MAHCSECDTASKLVEKTPYMHLYSCGNPAVYAGESRLIRPWLAAAGITAATIGAIGLIGGRGAIAWSLEESNLSRFWPAYDGHNFTARTQATLSLS